MNNSSKVLAYAGGGGPLLTDTIEESKAINCHSELRERAESDRVAIQLTNAASSCHAELDSASVPFCELPVSLDRFRNKFGMTVKSIVCMSAFTMAEILLSLTIIGVVAAITLPSLTGNINERTWNTQRKALYARFSQAIALMPALNSYGTYSQETDSAGSTSITDTAAETFITDGLAKVLKINNICDNEHLEDCGLSSKITTIAGSTINLPVKLTDLNSGIAGNIGGINVYDTKAAAFETINGESVLTFYNPNCASEGAVYTGVSAAGYQGVYVKHHVCANFVFDLNGNKGPNTVGKDIGVISAIYSTDSKVVMPVPTKRLSQTYEQTEAGGACADADAESRLPNIEELLALYYNATLLDSWLNSGYRWSSSVNDSQNAWAFGDTMGIKYSRPRDSKFSVQCVKR